jgi:hypothetical protein
MIAKQMRWLAAVGMAMGLPCLTLAQEVVWRPVPRTPAASAVIAPPPAMGPIATLGKPVPLNVAPVCIRPEPAAATAQAATLMSSPWHPASTRPGSTASIVRAQVAESDADRYPPPPSMPAGEIVPVSAVAEPDMIPISGSGVGIAPPQPPVPESVPSITPHTVSGPPDVPPPPVAPAPSDTVPGLALEHPVSTPTFWDKCKGWMDWGDKGSANGRHSCQSDTCFNGLISPVSNPFFFEDPRSLTEIRPIFMYQGIPSKSPYPGGDAIFFGTQARLAFTDRFSVVMNELGFVSIDPSHSNANINNDTGFAEIKIGPKYTFYRCDSTGTVAAAGLTFEIPTGSSRVYQDTGNLGLDPYVTIGQTFGRLPNGYGSFNVLGEAGYSFSIDDKRSEFFHASMHFDYNVANSNTIYPLLEFNWIHYTSSGKNTDLGFEGGDLVNFGSSTRQGHDIFTTAIGARYRFTDNIIAGAAIEFPLARERGFMDYRLTFDVIFRY